jgi:hypothetical protein
MKNWTDTHPQKHLLNIIFYTFTPVKLVFPGIGLGHSAHIESLWKQIFEEENMLCNKSPDWNDNCRQREECGIRRRAIRSFCGIHSEYLKTSLFPAKSTALQQTGHKDNCPALSAASSLQKWLPECQLLPTGVPLNPRNPKQLCESD